MQAMRKCRPGFASSRRHEKGSKFWAIRPEQRYSNNHLRAQCLSADSPKKNINCNQAGPADFFASASSKYESYDAWTFLILGVPLRVISAL
mmetsp:Transcript_46224/g.80843  ORF Transcript_46224/g.80843 Transcript_46224/m.80843 type:complete len:91 (-) Transcript_46224:275-547(-)